MAGVIRLHGGEGFLDTQGYHAYNCPRVWEFIFGFFFLLLFTHFIYLFQVFITLKVMIKCLIFQEVQVYDFIKFISTSI